MLQLVLFVRFSFSKVWYISVSYDIALTSKTITHFFRFGHSALSLLCCATSDNFIYSIYSHASPQQIRRQSCCGGFECNDDVLASSNWLTRTWVLISLSHKIFSSLYSSISPNCKFGWRVMLVIVQATFFLNVQSTKSFIQQLYDVNCIWQTVS